MYNKLLSIVQKVLIACIVLMSSVLLITLLYPIISRQMGAPAEIQAANRKIAVQEKIIDKKTAENKAAATQLPVTIELAENLFFSRHFIQAHSAYETLYVNVPEDNVNDMVAGFLRLRIGQCLIEERLFEEAQNYLTAAGQSKSPVIKTLANYYLANTYLELENWISARSAAYKALASADIPDDNNGWAAQLKNNSRLIVAEAVTRYALTLYDADKYDTAQMWDPVKQIDDPFTDLSEKQLSLFLTSGMEKLRKCTSAPIISVNDAENGFTSYRVTSSNTSVEELLARFAQNAQIEILFESVQGNANRNAKQQNVMLHLPDCSADQLLEIAAGCAGLLAQINEQNVTIKDMDYYSSISDYADMLSDEAISLWRKQSLINNSDDHTPGAHFALALLYSKKNAVPEAIAEYKLIANRFSFDKLAELSLLNSAKLKAKIHDYPGAEKDLEYLVEQYPETPTSYEGLLYLADLTQKTQRYKKACRLYNKVYYFSTDPKNRASAALGAGKSFCELKEYEPAAEWLDKYVMHATKLRDPNRYSTCYLLGKIYLNLGQYEKAYQNLHNAIDGTLEKNEYMDAITLLVNGYVKQKEFIKALDVLESDKISFSSSGYSTEILLLKSSLLRSMGIIDNNIQMLKLKIDRLVNAEIKGKALLELGLCYREKGDIELARQTFMEGFETVPAGELSNQLAWQIADTSFLMKQYKQAVNMCEHILKVQSDDQLRATARQLMASAYLEGKNYDKALAVLTE